MAKKEQEHIPQEGHELTADWFSDILGRTRNATVTSVDRSIIGAGIGFLGELHRCQLSWDRADEELPGSVIVKIPSKTLANRSVGEGLMAYEREIIAYRDLGDQLGVRMPEHYHSNLDPDPAPWLDTPIRVLFERLPIGGVNWVILQFLKLSGKSKRRYLLVMEDIADARSPTQVAGGSLADALQALEVLAGFHAHNWQSSKPAEASPRIWPLSRVPKVWQASYVRCRDEFISQFGEMLGPDVIKRLDQVQIELPAMLEVLGSDPWTLLHGDYRLDNLMYRPDGELVVLDYQLLGLGRPGWDVAYFITTALTADHRDEEGQMLRHYHDALVAKGVSSYSYDDLVADTEATKLLLAHRMVGSIDTLDTRMDGHDTSFVDLLVERVVGWIR